MPPKACVRGFVASKLWVGNNPELHASCVIPMTVSVLLSKVSLELLASSETEGEGAKEVCMLVAEG